MQLVWFRNDLRIADNTALSQARQQGSCLAIYFISLQQWQLHKDAPAKIDFQLRNLQLLQESLSALNIPLIVLEVDRWHQIPEKLTEFCLQLKITQVHCNQESPLNEQTRDKNCADSLAQQGIAFHAYQDHLLFKPGTLVTQKGDYFQVFSQFKKACLKRIQTDLVESQRAVTPQAPIKLHGKNLTNTLAQLSVATEIAASYPAGEAYAQQQLEQFTTSEIYSYHEQRDFPALQGTSRLSAYLNSGVLSIRQCLRSALFANQGELFSGEQGVLCWINELLWREFYHHILQGHPKLSRGYPFRDKTQFIQWRQAPDELAAWQTGNTGFPLVDAAMRQLKATGWMHNRLRMVTAMFLSKNLLINWRAGEHWFMQHLVDGEFAANNGGWQWSASTGTDSVPYFRLFNPITQSQRFDPKGTFIRHWLPELASLSDKSIHQPSTTERQRLNYPQPIVDLAFSRERVMQAFKAI
ncbi:deoxyribodipyrimidine photo-lyase [Pseudomonas sp. F1_0610]|uniref:deoxyribodipyrimidine photo-lyase n=1 Tax=Pseudomonas sp. F1_0610 TaxID=3114284 RepID=UPI0039C04295